MNAPVEALPLYGLAALGDARQVIVVGDEECRDALATATGRTVISWAGGTQGVKHTDWTPLAGRNVVIWPDADAPGLGTASEIAAILVAIRCTVCVMDVMRDDPPKNWDCADAIRDGWDKARLDAFMRETVRAWTPPKPPAPAVERPAPVAGPTSADLARKPTSASDLVEFRRRARSEAEAPILDPRDPMPSARALLADKFTTGGLPTMHHYRGTFWRWNGSCYRDADKDSVQAQIWRYLDGAKRYGKEGEKIDFQPNRGEVENVAAAFRAVCNLPSHVEAPAWLEDQGDMPLPVTSLPCGTACCTSRAEISTRQRHLTSV